MIARAGAKKQGLNRIQTIDRCHETVVVVVLVERHADAIMIMIIIIIIDVVIVSMATQRLLHLL